jgi:type VI secretion system secreted protein Hcp
LDIDGIPGESTDAKYKDQIHVQSWTVGVTQPHSPHSGGGSTAGKAAFADFSFVAAASKASPTLLLKCADGSAISKAVLTAVASGKDQYVMEQWILSGVAVTSFQSAASGVGGAAPVDQFSLAYSKIQFQFQSQNEKGAASGTTTVGWNLSTNTKI